MKKIKIEANQEQKELTGKQAFFQNIDYSRALQLSTCVRCGLCAQSCHYYLTDREVKSIPAYKISLVGRVFLYYFGFQRKFWSWWLGSQKLDSSNLDEWTNILFGRCSLCGRCSLNCPMGIKIHDLVRFGRSILARLEVMPQGLASTIKTALIFDNNMGIKPEEWVETVKWLEQELRIERGSSSLFFPLDRFGAKILYAINPREAKFFPLSLLAVGQIFSEAQESWTLSSFNYDATNYAYFLGDDKLAAKFFKRLEASMKRLGCQILVLTECGHGFNAARWESPGWLGYRPEFEIKNVLEIVAEYVKEGKLKLDPSRHKLPVTLHDPCNLVRLGGLLEEARFLLKKAVTHFVEMTPHGIENFCCGGGGGQLAMTEFASQRLKAGKLKAEQIKKTGAKIVVAPCHNCLDQLLELNRFYQLGIQVKTVCEVVAEALIVG
ncbi:MAG: (Fe-S)-binding protein [Candidatus Aminicenantes bacterium]|nr:(Fe-S)-binding protein [Candidatus Aminicenantes bacterium]